MKFSASTIILCALCVFGVQGQDAPVSGAPVTSAPVTGAPVTGPPVAPTSSANGDSLQLMTAAGIITLGAAVLGL